MDGTWDKSLNRWIRNLSPYGICEEDFIRRRDEFSKKPEAWTDRDVVWALFNDAVKKTDRSKLEGLYYLMSLFQNEEGNDSLAVRRASTESQFGQYARYGVKEVSVLAAPDSCDACKRLEGRKFTVEEVLKNHPLPCTECTRKLRKKDLGPFCRCIYLPVIPDASKKHTLDADNQNSRN